jgi:hypothetical protein
MQGLCFFIIGRSFFPAVCCLKTTEGKKEFSLFPHTVLLARRFDNKERYVSIFGIKTISNSLPNPIVRLHLIYRPLKQIIKPDPCLIHFLPL